MGVDVYVVFCHNAARASELEEMATSLPNGAKLNIVTAEDVAADILNIGTEGDSIDGPTCKERSPKISKPFNFITPIDEDDLLDKLHELYLREGRDHDFDRPAIMYVDITDALPWEAVAVCKTSAFVETCMFTNVGKIKRVSSFPRHLQLDETEITVLEHMMDRNFFTRKDMMTDLNLDSSASYRTINSLANKGCVTIVGEDSIDRRERPAVGHRKSHLYRVDKACWMMCRINHRSVGSLEECQTEPEIPISEVIKHR